MVTYDDFLAEWADVPPPDDPYDQAQPRSGFSARLLSRSALHNLPNPEPLIDNVLDQGTVALAYGKWGTGKSFIALDWACSVATGRHWQGRPTVQRRVLYVAAEGAFGLKGRTEAWERGWRVDVADGQFDVLPMPVNLTRERDVVELAALIAENGYGLVVFDTLARCMVGGDENSSRDCGVVVDAMNQLREVTPGGRGVILGIHHTGKDGKTLRGSSAFEAGADTVYFVGAEGGTILLDREKRKDGPRADLHRLRLDPVEGTGSVVVVSHRGETGDGRAESLLSTFESHFSESGAYSSALFEVSGLTRSTFYRALSDLLKRGLIVNTGTDMRPFYKLAAR